ncbi:hypothetical protein AB0H03_36155 [Streptomyces sparsogenes]|uniref:hypothetical protein n=1 Tax=Streptomyces sparsogenes TaxID=67365 RepID=UPI0033CAABD3
MSYDIYFLNQRGGQSPWGDVLEATEGAAADDPQTGSPLMETPPGDSIGLMSRITEDVRSRYGG